MILILAGDIVRRFLLMVLGMMICPIALVQFRWTTMVVLVRAVVARGGQIQKEQAIKVEHGKLEAVVKGSLRQGSSVFTTVQGTLSIRGLPPVLQILSVPLVDQVILLVTASSMAGNGCVEPTMTMRHIRQIRVAMEQGIRVRRMMDRVRRRQRTIAVIKVAQCDLFSPVYASPF
jgi:hypothetical protein